MDYRHRISTLATQTKILKALTTCIPNWWTADFSGSANKVDDRFTVRFGGTFKTFAVTTLNPPQVTWTCLDSFIDMPNLNKKDEWKNTKIHWAIASDGQQNHLDLVHEGLTPEVECFEVCQQGWTSFITSLEKWLEAGEGQPFTLPKESFVNNLNS